TFFNRCKSNAVLTFFLLAAIALSGSACSSGLVKNPFRDYSEKPFTSAEWLAGDAVERGRMYNDLYGSRAVDGKSKEEINSLLGEPEKKISVEGREVWLYRVEHSHQTPMKYFPVSFDTKRGAFAGRVKSGTVSILVKA
ncbi:MAG: hypothetical protein M3384_05855, partial [Acidobacteriota bacterium]|nr:hypothetical protein [Acidobacteriota bacterium]